tara:strand:+ start:5288 stop:5995 length:708 start_codon:yes stop_codon:yes gene_type:complete
MKALIHSLLILILLFSPAPTQAELSRETGAIYLEDVLEPDQSVILRVIHPAPIYYQLDGKRRLGTLRVGFDAEIVAISQKAYMVRAKAQHADVKGWISPQALQAHNGGDFVKVLGQLYQRQLVVQELIEKRQVALGMTLHEVQESLGNPDRINSAIDATGKQDTLEYVTYKRVAQTVTRFDEFGVPYSDIVYVNVEVGKVAIGLVDEIVHSINHMEAARNCGSGITLKPPPLLIF